MTTYQTEIVKVAFAWLDKQCYEVKENRGKCIDEIHKKYSNVVRAEAYCAKFIYVVYNEASNNLSIINPLFKTDRAINVLLYNAKNGAIIIQGTKSHEANILPADIMDRKSSSPTNSGHVGIVVGVSGAGLKIIEGNASKGNLEGVLPIFYTWDKIRNSKYNFNFIRCWQQVKDSQEYKKEQEYKKKEIKTAVASNFICPV